MRVPRARARRAAAIAVLIAVLTTALGGCGSDGEEGSPMEADQVEQVAREARGYIDQVAAALGRDPEVKQDTITDCVPGDSDSGKSLIYAVHVQTQGDKESLLASLREDWEAQGWSVEAGGSTDVALSKDRYSIAVTISDQTGRAAVIGGGGCVE
jgi:hypothetical protein